MTEKPSALEERLIKTVGATAPVLRGPIIDTFYLSEGDQARLHGRLR